MAPVSEGSIYARLAPLDQWNLDRLDFIKIDVEGFELPVILGLSQPVPCLSFEWTPEFSQAAWDCLDHLAGIGDIETNYSLGESMLWAAEQWMKPVQLKTALAAYENDIKHFGDIYVRFP